MAYEQSAMVGIQKVAAFIRTKLPKKLKKDLLELRMMKEADLECRAYYHVSRFLLRQPEWKIFARKYSPTEHFIDLLLFKNQYPRIAIELKWNKTGITEKDRKSLHRAIETLGVQKAYFITTLIGGKKYQRITKKDYWEKGALIGIYVPLSLNGEKLKRWKEQRQVFMKNMQPSRKGKKSPANPENGD
jgi:hypothetical protein